MKKILLLLLFINVSVFSQEIKLADLIFIYTNDVEKSDEYISKKEYYFHDVDSGKPDLTYNEIIKNKESNNSSLTPVDEYGIPIKNKTKTMTWSYKRNELFTNKAESFISKYCFKSKCGFVWFQTLNRKTFDNIKNECKQKGFKFVKTYVDELNNLCSVFKSSSYEIEFLSGVNEYDKVIYNITLEM